MNRYLKTASVLALLLASLSSAHAQSREATWEAPPASTQMAMDETIIPVGKGAVFCPAMTGADNEPMYGVLQNGNIDHQAKMGSRIGLEPGIYTIVYGSGTVDQMMRKKVRVVEGATTLIKPDWSGLIVEVINQSRADVREYYELYDLISGDSYGIGQGVEEGLDEVLRTWILPPGVYKIVKPGDNVNAVTNFGTIRLLPGELVRTSLVIDTTSGNFLGFGHVANVRQVMRGQQKKWRTRSEISGNALLNYVPTNQSGGEKDASFTATLQWLTDARYESGRHIIPVWSNIEEGLSMSSEREIFKYIDKAELRLTYIFRLSNLLSPYMRGTVETRFFETDHRFEDPSTFFKVDDKGDTLSVVHGAETVGLGKAFSPVYLKQGFGITSAIIQSVPANLHIRSGYGARQIFARGASIFDSSKNILSPMIESDITGFEMLMLGDFRLGRYLLFNTEFDILMPKSDRDTWVYDSENRLRFNITSNVSLLLKAEYWKDENYTKTQSRYQMLLRFSKYL